VSKAIPIFSLLLLLNSSNAFSQGISEAICETYVEIMRGQTLPFRQIGIPVRDAEDTYNSEDDVRTRVFLKRVVRIIYANPVGGQNYIDSGKFLQDCIKVHRGY
jgi:hypothetical protein